MRSRDGGVGCSAVADTALDDGIAAVGGDIAATDCAIGCNTGCSSRRYGRKSAWGGDGALLTIDGAIGIGGVGSHIIGGGRLQAAEGADEGAESAAVGGVQVADGGLGGRAPADTTGGDGIAGIVCDSAATLGCATASEGYVSSGADRWETIGGGER